MTGTQILMARRYVLVLSMMGDVTAEVTRPTTMRRAPAMPASVSENE